jgi:hypothetical protein
VPLNICDQATRSVLLDEIYKRKMMILPCGDSLQSVSVLRLRLQRDDLDKGIEIIRVSLKTLQKPAVVALNNIVSSYNRFL